MNKGLWGDGVIFKCLKTNIKETKRLFGIGQGDNSKNFLNNSEIG